MTKVQAAVKVNNAKGIIIIILFEFKFNNFLNLYNPHVATLIEAGCINTFFTSLDKVGAEIENRFSGNDQDGLCALDDVTLSYSPASDSFDLVAGFYNFDWELHQADKRLFSRFKKTYVENSIKTAAEVIDVLPENSLFEITPEFSKMAFILAVIPATSCSAERLFSGLLRLKTYLRNTMGQHRLNSVAIICIKRAYGKQVALLTIWTR